MEARYYQVDFGALSLRKALNLTFDMLWEAYAHKQDEWNRRWAPIFDPDDRTVDAPEPPPSGSSVQIAKAPARKPSV